MNPLKTFLDSLPTDLMNPYLSIGCETGRLDAAVTKHEQQRVACMITC